MPNRPSRTRQASVLARDVACSPVLGARRASYRPLVRVFAVTIDLRFRWRALRSKQSLPVGVDRCVDHVALSFRVVFREEVELLFQRPGAHRQTLLTAILQPF